MTEEKQASVPYFVHEGMVARMERMFKLTVISLIFALAFCVCSLVINDMMWRKHVDSLESRYEKIYESIQNNSGIHEQSDQDFD